MFTHSECEISQSWRTQFSSHGAFNINRADMPLLPLLVSFFRSLWWFLCLYISVQDRAFFSWPFQFGIWCLYYNCRQLISVSRDIWNVQPPQFLHHPLKLLHRTASSQFSEVWSFSHLISPKRAWHPLKCVWYYVNMRDSRWHLCDVASTCVTAVEICVMLRQHAWQPLKFVWCCVNTRDIRWYLCDVASTCVTTVDICVMLRQHAWQPLTFVWCYVNMRDSRWHLCDVASTCVTAVDICVMLRQHAWQPLKFVWCCVNMRVIRWYLCDVASTCVTAVEICVMLRQHAWQPLTFVWCCVNMRDIRWNLCDVASTCVSMCEVHTLPRKFTPRVITQITPRSITQYHTSSPQFAGTSFRSLVFFTFNFSNLDFPMMLTFPISLSASSCEFAQSAVSSAYLRLETNFPPIFIPISSIPASRITDSVYY